MTIESQSNEVTEQELFDQIMEAKAAGKDYKSIVSKAEITFEDVDQPEPEVPEVKDPVVPESAETPATEEAKTPEAPAATTAAPSDDWDAELPDEVKEKIRALREERNQLDHRVKSELGRVPYLQRKVEELSRQLSGPRTEPATKAEPAATKTSTTKSKFEEKLAQAREVDPALADILEAMREEIVNPLREELTNEVNQTKAMFVDRQQEELWHNEKAKLLQQVPEADAVFKHPLYKQWKNEIPENLQRLAGSIYADEVVIALEQFAKWAAVQAPELAVQPAQASAASPAPPASPPAAAAKVVADRARKLAGTPPSNAGSAPKGGDGVPDDPEALFKYVTDKIRKGESFKV